MLLLGAGLLVVAIVGIALDALRDDSSPHRPPTDVASPPVAAPSTAPPAAAPPPSSTAQPPAPVPSAAAVTFSWAGAGAFVWHETDVDPALLGRSLRDAGFDWVAVRVQDGLVEDPVEDDWVNRIRRESGLAVGGWGVLRTDPVAEATLAARLVEQHGLAFYIANAEVEYEFSGSDGPSDERSARSRRFVSAFRRLEPQPFPAGLSTYCRADRHDIDWASWSAGGFAFLPQAYANELGSEGSPVTCARAARGFFDPTDVHPTVGVYAGRRGVVSPSTYVARLARAGTRGFSVYLAETRMTDADWRTFGAAIDERGIAERP